MKKNQCCECGEIIGINEDPDNWGLCASCQEWYSEDGPLANLDDSSELEWYANFLVEHPEQVRDMMGLKVSKKE